MTEQMMRIVKSKEAERRSLAALPFSDKIAILEKLRDRSLSIARSSLSAGAVQRIGPLRQS